MKNYNEAYFEQFFQNWRIPPELCEKWQNAEQYSFEEFRKICIFSEPIRSRGFQLYLIKKQNKKQHETK